MFRKYFPSLTSRPSIKAALFLLAGATLATGVALYRGKEKKKTQWAILSVARDVCEYKAALGLPAWATQQIAADLAPFAKKGFARAALDAAMTQESAKQYELVRWTICGNRLSYWTLPEFEKSKAFYQTRAALQTLCDTLPVPDVDWIMSFSEDTEVPACLHGIPVFRYTKKEGQTAAVLLPDFKALAGYAELRKEMAQACADHPWESKCDKAFWRGSSTGGYFDFDNWDSYPRSQLVLLSLRHPHLIDARYTAIAQCAKGLPQYLKQKGLVACFCPRAEHVRYKYQIDVDGNTSTYERFFWELLCNCVTLKQASDHVQWYYKALKPYEHFIPIERDLSDLTQKIEWAKEHDEAARAIADNATRFVQENLMPEDVLLYLHALLSAYAKIPHN